VEAHIPVICADGTTLTAFCHVIERHYPQYCGGLALEEEAQIIAQATGERGPNFDCLWSTAAHLAALDSADPDLGWLAARMREICR